MGILRWLTPSATNKQSYQLCMDIINSIPNFQYLNRNQQITEVSNYILRGIYQQNFPVLGELIFSPSDITTLTTTETCPEQEAIQDFMQREIDDLVQRSGLDLQKYSDKELNTKEKLDILRTHAPHSIPEYFHEIFDES